MNQNNIIYESQERGIMICLRQEDVKIPVHIATKYPLILVRCATARFAVSNRLGQHSYAWVNNIIVDTFKQIGFTVKPSIRPNQYTIVGKKDKFQFVLKYGRWGDK